MQLVTLPLFPTPPPSPAHTKVKLCQYEIPSEAMKLLSRGMKMTSATTEAEASALRAARAALEDGARRRDLYAARFRTLLWAEEHQMQVDIRHYDMEVRT